MEHPHTGPVALLMPRSGFQNLFLQPAAVAGCGVKGVGCREFTDRTVRAQLGKVLSSVAFLFWPKEFGNAIAHLL